MEDDFKYLVFVAEKLLDLGDWSRQNLFVKKSRSTNMKLKEKVKKN